MPHPISQYIDVMWCPRCGGDLELSTSIITCENGHSYEIAENIPRLFTPHAVEPSSGDVTEAMKKFYEETPFPNYDDFDDVGSLQEKARAGVFAKMLDDQVPFGARILECGCGTGQMSNFLSIANRNVVGTDMSVPSLRLGQQFKERNSLERVLFLQMNLFKPAFRPESFDLVISNGVLHHTSDPLGAFLSIAPLVRPGGYILIGLYHRYGRLITDARRLIFRFTRDHFTWLDPNLRKTDTARGRRRAWFMDQYKNPHESKHTIGETLGWLQQAGLEFVRSIPTSYPFEPFSVSDRLFEPQRHGNYFERLMVELGMISKGSREGGFFIILAQRPRR